MILADASAMAFAFGRHFSEIAVIRQVDLLHRRNSVVMEVIEGRPVMFPRRGATGEQKDTTWRGCSTSSMNCTAAGRPVADEPASCTTLLEGVRCGSNTTSLPPQLPLQPGLSEIPVAPHRSRGGLENLCNFFFAQPAEVTQFDNLSLAGSQLCECFQRLIQRHKR